MVRSPLNNVILKLKTKYIRNFSNIAKIAAIQNNTSIDPADFVNIIGEVVSTPLRISGKREYRGFSCHDIRPGDTAIISCLVVYEFANTAPEEEPIFKNSFWYKDTELWNCDITRLFAVIRDGEIRMQNGYVMVENMEPPPKIILTAQSKKRLNTASATVSAIGNPLVSQSRIGVEQGETVYFNQNVLQRFQINDKPFGILRQSDILGKTCGTGQVAENFGN